MIDLMQYSVVKDKFCICYFGNTPEYIVLLNILKPLLEKEFTGLSFYICAKDEFSNYIDAESFIKLSEIKNRNKEFGHIYEIQYNGKDHPIEKFLLDSDVENLAVPISGNSKHTLICTILPHGQSPTRDLNSEQIDLAKRLAVNNGFTPIVNGGIEDASMVIGVECPQLYLAASQGISTTLIPNGNGHNLFKKMFPNNQVVSL